MKWNNQYFPYTYDHASLRQWGEWQTGITRQLKKLKVSGSNPTDAPSLGTRHRETPNDLRIKSDMRSD